VLLSVFVNPDLICEHSWDKCGNQGCPIHGYEALYGDIDKAQAQRKEVELQLTSQSILNVAAESALEAGSVPDALGHGLLISAVNKGQSSAKSSKQVHQCISIYCSIAFQ
jgi:hypothetical protein